MEENKPLENLTPETPVLPETPINTPANSVFDQKKKPWVKIAILLIVILLVCGGLVYAGMEIQKRQASSQHISNPEVVPTSTPAVIATVTPDPTTDWKTYTSPEKTYSFKYPNDSCWKIFPNTAPLGSSVSLQAEKCVNEEYVVDLFQANPVIYTSLEEYETKFEPITDHKRITLSGQEVVKAIIPGGPQSGGSFLEVFAVYKGQGYVISQRFPGLMDKNKLTDLPDPNPDILSTFKFVN